MKQIFIEIEFMLNEENIRVDTVSPVSAGVVSRVVFQQISFALMDIT